MSNYEVGKQMYNKTHFHYRFEHDYRFNDDPLLYCLQYT